VYGGAHALLRTDGVRGYVADKVSDWVRLPVAIDSSSGTLLLGINLKGLSFDGVEIERLSVEWGLGRWLDKESPRFRKLVVRGADLKLRRQTSGGAIEPLVFNPLAVDVARVLGLGGVSREFEQLPRLPAWLLNGQTELRLERVDLAIGESVAVNGLSVQTEVVHFSGRDALQSRVAAEQVHVAAGMISSFALETIAVDRYPGVLLLGMETSDLEYEGFESADIWGDLADRFEVMAR
jgi:hypothetical protein